MAVLLLPTISDLAQGATLSGTVYVDVNNTGALMTGDLAVNGALVELFNQSDLTTPYAQTYTNMSGQYSFANIPVGTYTLKNASPSSAGNSSNVGLIYNANINDYVLSDLGSANSAMAQISDINLASGYQAMNYNFGNDQFPLQLYSKRYLIAGSDNYIQPVPEPAVFVSLLTLLGMAGGWTLWRRAAS
jgi:hypothetical protein